MTFDDLTSAWQEQNEQSLSPEVREAMIVRVCRRVERLSRAMVVGDVIETIAALVVVIAFGWYCYALPADYVVSKSGAGFLMCHSLFIIYKVHRRRRIEQPASLDAPLLEYCRVELDRLDRQICRSRSALWWSVVPGVIGVNMFFIGLEGLGAESLVFGIVTLLPVWGIMAIEPSQGGGCLQRARRELAYLLDQLEEAGSSAWRPIEQPPERSSKCRRFASATVFLAALAALGIGAADLVDQATVEYPKRAPFTGIRWEGDKPVVKIGREWFTLVSIEGIAAEDIVAFSWRTYMDRWRKRFEEDLVEVLTRMGHEPKDAVRLVVLPLGSAEAQTLENVPMTEENRWAIYRANSQMSDSPPRSSGSSGESLASLITDLRHEKNLVGLAAMATVDGQVEAAAAYGERKLGSGAPLELGDRWHLGGIAKSITATMIARLVESGQMKWSDTVGEFFPEASVHKDWNPVTLRQLLTDTGGAPASFPREIWRGRPALGPERIQARRVAVLKVIAAKPAYPPGERHAYSNVGYAIAGAMAETATGAAWEELVKWEVFDPLELTEAGFGPPKSGDETLEQPRGHRAVRGAKIPVDDQADNTPIMWPAAAVHMTLENLCTFAREHLLGQLGRGELLSEETYKLLHTPELSQYACGWIRKEPDEEIPFKLYWHNGSNTMWYALVAFIPEKNMVVAVTSNDGDIANAESAAWEIVKSIANQFNAEDGRQSN
jgi:CubicO group peptidase (beta-lactamase class C family)